MKTLNDALADLEQRSKELKAVSIKSQKTLSTDEIDALNYVINCLDQLIVSTRAKLALEIQVNTVYEG